MINLFHTHIHPAAHKLIRNVLDTTWVSEGPYVKKFEKRLIELGLNFPVAVNSCTSALHLALHLAGVYPGDEVILPAQTFIATAHAILYRGAKPIFVDIEPDSGNIDANKIVEKIGPRTKIYLRLTN